MTNLVIMESPSKATTVKGGTMRLGSYTCALAPGSLAGRIYGGAVEIRERHRHRYYWNHLVESFLTMRCETASASSSS